MTQKDLGSVKVEEVVVVTQPRYKSWVLWTSIAALICYVALRFFNIDIDNTVNTLLELALPILVGFGIINDPTVKNHMFDYAGQMWYQSARVWIALSAFLAYVLQLITKHDVNTEVNTITTLILSILTAYGIVKPTSPTPPVEDEVDV